ncbi:FixH family protein [Sphingomonas hengshuiensis]|uniref:Nitrogen fixation protein FixH n=1 Tax=Sphingomonas hengshuiensis TaxID=1609977 RepID=A0A7U4LEW1_9SPHN|nr:FixH family protein [Sphingomonas hengshuiensis]AJP71810.1 hypothetical protein TS85_08470 [Sphingomonas hengshuiensis]
MTRSFRFTGWHMFATIALFFGVVIGVNMTMATLATRTFGGVVVANSYVASQEFNGWLKAAEAQKRLGWEPKLESIDQRLVVATSARHAVATAVARHPLGRLPDVAIRFTETAPGRFVADTRLPAGRWRVHLTFVRGADRADFVRDVAA